MNSELLCIIAYSVMWSLAFLLYFKKKKQSIGIAGYMILVYALMSYTSIYFYFNVPVMREVFNVTFLPLIYLMVCILLWIRPFLKYDNILSEVRLVNINDKNNLINIMLIMISPLILFTFFESFMMVINIDTMSLGDAYANKDVSATSSLSRFGRLGYTIAHWGTYMWPMIFFNGLSRGGKSAVYAYIALVAYFIEIMIGYANGDRVTLVRFFLYIGITFLLMRNLLDDSTSHKIKRVGIISFASIVLLLSFITISRLNDISRDYDMGGFVSLYSGEGCIRFSQYIWDLHYYSDGDTSFSLLKNMAGLDTFTDNFARREYYEGKMGIPTYIFYTFIGDFYQDLGRIGTLIFSIIASLFIEKLLNSAVSKGYCNYIPFFLLTLIIQVIFFGFMYYNFKTYNDQLQLIAPFVFFAIIDFTNTRKRAY